MTSKVDYGIPLEFGGSWDRFSREWCLNGSLATSRENVARALATLARLWPEEVARLVGDRTRGLGVVSPAVEVGLLLSSCEQTEGFAEVLPRMKSRERSAYSELVLVAALRTLGVVPRFAAPIEGRLLDAACEINGSPLYIEVVAPDPSDASGDYQKLVDSLNAELRGRVSSCRVEVELFGRLDSAGIAAVAKAVVVAIPSEWLQVDTIGRIRRVPTGQALPPVFDGDGPQIVIAGESSVQGSSTGVIVRWESTDARAKRIFNGEYHHFSDTVANLLVVNVCAVSDGMKAWPVEMARLLQPTRNRKVGAIAFFEQGSLGQPEGIRRRWRVLVNLHAYLPVPDSLLSGLESLDESQWYGLTRLERVVAA